MKRPRKNLSEYALSLQDRREIKKEYGASGSREELEKRLDNIVFRAGFALTRRAARQLVSHRHIELNNKRVNIPSIKVKIKDGIRLRSSKFLPEDFKKYKSPDWLKLDRKKLIVQVITNPKPLIKQKYEKRN